ncbi:hypothetical protein M3A96_08925 [Helcobacillus massiliensis]|uniref:hypothetical protein n=1 Tax=Helcobacillus massiliensis TaxID=521392 RepID=UPI0021A4068B|nr:hypothetical protein [Helcobacillus massiliensis]MCT1558235.1 hypothetical protein [Helcobacillus massiliensis]MCT2035526.1 hypothetical protein [Helcobacillus massiliensis]MCT2331979.1 hypothetical protein [Helcobacillus massiliensis]
MLFSRVTDRLPAALRSLRRHRRILLLLLVTAILAQGVQAAARSLSPGTAHAAEAGASGGTGHGDESGSDARSAPGTDGSHRPAEGRAVIAVQLRDDALLTLLTPGTAITLVCPGGPEPTAPAIEARVHSAGAALPEETEITAGSISPRTPAVLVDIPADAVSSAAQCADKGTATIAVIG